MSARAGLFACLLLAGIAGPAGCGSGDAGSASADPPELAGTSWVLDTSALGVAGAQDVKATLAFERDGVAGSDGCNRIFGPYDQDETRLELGPLASTKMACAGAAGEVADRVSPALGQVASFSLDGDRLTLRDAGGRALLAYVRGSAA